MSNSTFIYFYSTGRGRDDINHHCLIISVSCIAIQIQPVINNSDSKPWKTSLVLIITIISQSAVAG